MISERRRDGFNWYRAELCYIGRGAVLEGGATCSAPAMVARAYTLYRSEREEFTNGDQRSEHSNTGRDGDNANADTATPGHPPAKVAHDEASQAG